MTTTTKSPPKRSTRRKPAGGNAEAGTAILETLTKRVEAEVGPFDRKPNKSRTYTRLQLGGKTFAYLFPPRANGLLVKIPKPFLPLERDLPKGHGFRRTKHGLTKTLERASEAPITAKAFAVAAKAIRAEDGE